MPLGGVEGLFAGASWAEDGSIFVSDAGGKGLLQLRDGGGAAKIVGDVDMFGDTPAAGSIAFAGPKSSTFTVPSLRTLMFAGSGRDE